MARGQRTYTEVDKARAVTLADTAGMSAAAISREMQVPERTVQHWLLRLRQVAGEKRDATRIRHLEENDRIIARATELTHDVLDGFAAMTPGKLVRHAKDISLIRGIALDKAAGLERGHDPDQMPFVIVMAPAPAPPPTPDDPTPTFDADSRPAD